MLDLVRLIAELATLVFHSLSTIFVIIIIQIIDSE